MVIAQKQMSFHHQVGPNILLVRMDRKAQKSSTKTSGPLRSVQDFVMRTANAQLSRDISRIEHADSKPQKTSVEKTFTIE